VLSIDTEIVDLEQPWTA